MTPVALGIQQIVGGDQADTRARSRVSGVRDRVDPVFLDPRDTRVFGAQLLVWSIAADRGLIPDLVDCFTIGRKREREARFLRLFFEHADAKHYPPACALDRGTRLE